MFMISDLQKLKNFLPIIYLGHAELNVAKLVIIVGKLRISKKIEYFLVLNKKFAEKYQYDFVIDKDIFLNYKKYFKRCCWVEEIFLGDTIKNFMDTNKISFYEKSPMLPKNPRYCYYGKMEEYIEDLPKINKNIKNCNFEDNLQIALDRSDVIVGRESPELLAAAYTNKIIYLTDSISDNNSFQMIFPNTKSLC